MPPELQQRVHEEVELTKRRSGWPVVKTLAALGVTRTTYYRWLREEAWAKARPAGQRTTSRSPLIRAGTRPSSDMDTSRGRTPIPRASWAAMPSAPAGLSPSGVPQ